MTAVPALTEGSPGGCRAHPSKAYEPRWWSKPDREDPADRAILTWQRERDELRRARRQAAIESTTSMCLTCGQSVPGG